MYHGGTSFCSRWDRNWMVPLLLVTFLQDLHRCFQWELTKRQPALRAKQSLQPIDRQIPVNRQKLKADVQHTHIAGHHVKFTSSPLLSWLMVRIAGAWKSWSSQGKQQRYREKQRQCAEVWQEKVDIGEHRPLYTYWCTEVCVVTHITCLHVCIIIILTFDVCLTLSFALG